MARESNIKYQLLEGDKQYHYALAALIRDVAVLELVYSVVLRGYINVSLTASIS